MKRRVLKTKIRESFIDAEIYDAQFSFQDDIPFWIKWCKKSGSNVLELACGTGRVGIPLIKSGFNYTGVDYSHEFIEKAQNKAKSVKGKYEFHCQNIVKLNLNRKFDSIIIPFNSLTQITEIQDLAKILRNVKKHLKPKGIFIFQLINPDPERLSRNPKKKFPMRDVVLSSGGKVKASRTFDYDRATQILRHQCFYEFEGKTIKREMFIRHYYPMEIDAILYYNGFKIIKKMGDFDGCQFSPESPYQIIAAQKIGASI